MFTAKSQDYEITINCEPNEFVWKKYFPETGRYMYKYPDVPEFLTDYEIFGDQRYVKMQPAPEVGEKWCVMKTSWKVNGVEDDFFDLDVGDLIQVVAIEEYEDGAWTAFAVCDERMATINGVSPGETFACFTNVEAQMQAIVRFPHY